MDPSLDHARIDTHHWRGYGLVAAAALCWGASATAGKAAFNGNLFAGRPAISPLLLTQARTTFAVLLLFGYLLLAHGRSFLRITRRDLAWCALAGTLGTAGANFFYYYAVQQTAVAIAITVQYTAPVWVLLFMVASGRERLTASRVLSVAMALIGIALTIRLVGSGMNTSVSRLPLAGVAASLAASFSFAFYNVVTPDLVRGNPPLKVMLFSLGSSAALWNLLNPPWRLASQGYSAGQWGFLFFFALLSMLLPYLLFLHGVRHLDPTRAIIASCLEPVFAILVAAAVLGERLGGWQILGVVIVLAATVMAQTEPRGTRLS